MTQESQSKNQEANIEGPRHANQIQKILSRTSVKSRLLVSLILLSVFPILLLGIISFLASYRDMEQKSIDYSTSVAVRTTSSIGAALANHVDKLKRISSNSVILHEIYNLQSSSIDEYSPNTVRQTLASIIGPGIGMDSVEIVVRTGARIYYSTPITKGMLADSQFLQDTESGEDVVWKISTKEIASDPETYIILSRRMYLDPKDNVSAGYCFMSLHMNYLNELCQQDGVDPNQLILIADADGKIIAGSEKALVNSPMESGVWAHIVANDSLVKGEANGLVPLNQTNFSIDTQDGRQLVSYQTLALNQWRIITMTPYAYLMQNTYRNGVMFLLAILVIGLLALVIALLIRDSITSPINRLNELISEVAKGNFKHASAVSKLEPDTKNELVILEDGFHVMVSRVESLIDDVYKAKIKEQKLEFLRTESELDALQQQINPHFLYNILDAIYWTAQCKGDEEVSEMVTALGKFFRSSVNKGLEYITVAEEVANVQNYVYLQRIRFSERFDVTWEIDDKILECRIIKLILQPIIENAIVHGIEALESGGLISIKGFTVDEKICFEIADNGVGMSEEDVDQLITYINDPIKNLSGSIGVKNVNQRIKLYYGNAYGVSIASTPLQGTIVSLTLPALR